jgi:hypothetical protein
MCGFVSSSYNYPIIIGSFVITDAQVRFYQAMHKVVNIFTPRVLRAAMFLGTARVSCVDDSESFRESRTSSFRPKSESGGGNS